MISVSMLWELLLKHKIAKKLSLLSLCANLLSSHLPDFCCICEILVLWKLFVLGLIIFNLNLLLILWSQNKVNKMRSCGHTSRIACAVDLEQEPCTEKCIKTRSCGHECTKLCSDDCNLCEALVFLKPF